MVSVMSGSPPVARRRRWTASPRTDLALALLLGAVLLQSASDEQGLKQPAWAVIGLIELTVLPLALRRSRPVAVLAVTLAAAILGDLLFVGFQFPGPAIALYTVAAHCERRLAVAAAGATALALVVPAVARGGVDEPIFVVADVRRLRRGVGTRGQPAHASRLPRRARGSGRAPGARAGGDRAAGGRRGAGADRARVARRDLAQRERDGRAGGRRR